MRVGVVDIGTNSTRLLITDGELEQGRWVVVTGLGRGVDARGDLSEVAIADTIDVLDRYGRLMDEASVALRAAIATSAARDAANREEFFDRAEEVLAIRPELLSGEDEARLAYSGATARVQLPQPVMVSDIGGGSTEFVSEDQWASIDIGSVRLTERCVPTRPAPSKEVEEARAEVRRLFSSVDLPAAGSLMGVAGTWTSIAAIAQDLVFYDRDKVDGYLLSAKSVEQAVERLRVLTVDETAQIPSLDPRRAPVILAGAIVAAGVCEVTDAEQVFISEHDSLDGVAMRLLALR